MELVKESLGKFQEFTRENELKKNYDEDEFLVGQIQKLNEISNEKEMIDHLRKMTMGWHFPLNPAEPFRSILKNKILEVYDESSLLINTANFLDKEWEEIKLPPGVVY